MLHYDLWGTRRSFPDLQSALRDFWKYATVRSELSELLDLLDEKSSTLTRPSGLAPEIPLQVHGTYTRDELLGAYSVGTPARPPTFREGVRYVEPAATDLLLVTLKKAERDYSQRRCTATTRLHRTSSIGSRSPSRRRVQRQSGAIKNTEIAATRSCSLCVSASNSSTGWGRHTCALGPLSTYPRLATGPSPSPATGNADAGGAVRGSSKCGCGVGAEGPGPAKQPTTGREDRTRAQLDGRPPRGLTLPLRPG